jgi:hypothetical protein
MDKPIYKLCLYDPGQYEVVREWWVAHGWGAVPSAILPKFGVMAFFGETPLACAWLYMDNSVGVSMLEWMVSNPDASPRKVLKAINLIVDFMGKAAADMDYGVMLTTCKQESLAKVYERAGFARTDSEMIHFVRRLK